MGRDRRGADLRSGSLGTRRLYRLLILAHKSHALLSVGLGMKSFAERAFPIPLVTRQLEWLDRTSMGQAIVASLLNYLAMRLTASTNWWRSNACLAHCAALLCKVISEEKHGLFYDCGYHDRAELPLEAYYIERNITAYAGCKCV